MQASPRRIRRTVSRARGVWYRLGVPRDVRDRLAADLRAELEAAAARDLPVEFVVGDDLAAFATTRAPREGRRNTAWLLGEFALGLVVVPALLSLVSAVLYDRPVGFHVHELVWVLGVVFGAASLQAARERRGTDADRDGSRLGPIGLVVFPVGGFMLSMALEVSPRFVAIPPPLAWGVLAATVVAQLVVSRRRRVRWRAALDASA